MARNRKRRSDRRPHRSGDGPGAKPGLATTRASRRPDAERPEAEDLRRDGPLEEESRLDEAPDPIEHGTPDVELAEAQLAVGRPDPSEAPSDEELLEEALDAGDGGGGGRSRRSARRGGGGDGGSGGSGAEEELARAPVPAQRSGLRLVHFLQGSWRELQRVQWPDRRQVMQATGVVIGFVIVAGVFLGVADLIANKVVQLILK